MRRSLSPRPRAAPATILAAVIVIAPVLGLTRPVLAQTIPTGPELRVNTTTAWSQRDPAVAMAADGRFVVTWESDGQDGSGLGVYAQRYDEFGYPRGTELRVNTTTASTQASPAVAMAADGRFVVAWTSFGQDGDGYGVYAQRYAPDGTPRGTEFRVNTTTAGNQWAVAAAMAADGQFVIAWESRGQDGSGSGVYAQRYTADGTLSGTELSVNTTTAGDQVRPSVGMAPDGRFVVAWDSSSGQDGSGEGVYARRYAADGTPRDSEFLVNTTTAGDQVRSSVALGADGQLVITWTSAGQDGNGDDVYVQRYADDGTPQGGEVRVNQTTAGTQRVSSVGMASDGRFAIAWQSNPQDGSWEGVYAQRYAPDGTPRGGEFRVNTTTAESQVAPAVAMGADGRFVVAWESDHGDPLYNVFAQRYLVNEAPAVTLSRGVLTYTEGSGPQLMDDAAMVADQDSADFAGGALTVALQGGLPEDRLVIRHQGLGAGQIGVSGGLVIFDGSQIGTAAGLGTSGPLVVQLNAVATPAAVQALLRNVTYENASPAPATIPRNVRVRLTDGDGETSALATRTILVAPVNQAPTATNDAYTLSGPTLTVSGLGVLANDADVDSGTLTAQLVAGPGAGTLTLDPSGSFTYTPGQSYAGTDSFTYRASDGAAQSGVATVTLSGPATSCRPRPKVETRPVAGGGKLEVTVAATPSGTGVPNRLREVRFGDPANGVADPQNARIVLNGQARTGRFTHTVTADAAELTFSIERVTPGQATTVHLAVVDGCGTWKTFVGGGTAAGF